jgi:hypothetical protein
MSKTQPKPEKAKPAGKTAQPAASEPAAASTPEAELAARQHVEGLLIRGEAVKTADGKLPAGATHEIVEEPDGKPPKVVRRRFALR